MKTRNRLWHEAPSLRDFSRRSVRRLGIGWLWALVVLALPNCAFDPTIHDLPPSPNPLPHTTLVYCDIERPLGRHCATDTEKATGIPLEAAAVALVAGQSGGNIALDES